MKNPKIFLTFLAYTILTMLYGVDNSHSDRSSTVQWAQVELASSRDSIPGCTDPYAGNYDPDATYNDGSCSYDEEFEQIYTFLGTVENSSYYISDIYLNWWDANDSTTAHGGFLASLTTEEENMTVSAWAQEFDDPNWIGLYQDTESDDYSEPLGGWSWVTEECFDYAMWAPGEPNNSADVGVTNWACTGCWDDYDGNGNFRWIMERDSDIDSMFYIVIDNTTLDFGESLMGGTDTQYVNIFNGGTVDLEVSDVQSSGADFTVSSTGFSISPCDTFTLEVTFSPTSIGEQIHTISINTNDPNFPIIEVSVSGTGVGPPDIDVAPLSLHADLLTGDSTIQTITITNHGSSDLVWSVSAESASTDSRDIGDILDDFTFIGEFEGHQYYLSNDRRTWTAAYDTIQSWGDASFNLATISSDEENDFINEASNYNEVWIGFTDQYIEGEWVWVTGEPVVYTNWAGGEPNNAGGQEDWAHLWGDGRWNDHEQYYETYFVIESGSPNWIHTSIDSGTISPGETQDVQVIFDATEMLFGGEYAADLVIVSNDPDESEVVVSATMTLTPIPEISVEPLAIDFGDSYTGFSTMQHISVSNVGTGYLVISDVQSSGSDFTVWPTEEVSISPGNQYNFEVHFNPSSTGEQSHTITINSNDSDTPTVDVSVSGTGIEPPVIEVDPTYLYTDLSFGDSTTQTFTIQNTGGGTMEWSTFFSTDYWGANTLDSDTVEGSSPMYDLEVDNSFINYGNNGVYSSYRGTQDLDLTIGDLVFSAWPDTNNTNLYSLSPSGDMSLMFAGIEIMGENSVDFEVLAVTDNGSILFNEIEPYDDYYLFHLKRMDPDETVSHIATFTSHGGDWDIDSWGNIVYITNNDLFLVSPYGHVQQVAWGAFDGADAVAVHPKTGDYYVADSQGKRIVRVRPDGQVDHLFEDHEHFGWIEGLDFTPEGTLIIADEGTNAIYSFNGMSLTTIAQGGLIENPEDVVVDQEGNYLVPMDSYDGENDSTKCSIVKVTPDGDVTYLIEREFVYIDNIGIYRNMPTPWVSTDITSGTIAPGSQQTVEVSFNASDIFGGSHHRNITIDSNAPYPDNGIVNVSANADVTGIPNISAENSSVVLDPVYVGSTSVGQITIFSNGTDVLEVFDVQSSSSDLTVSDTYFILHPLEFNTFFVDFTPSSIGYQTATLTLTSNDPDMPHLEISVSCTGMGFPDIAFDPDSLHSDLGVGATTSQTVMISNEGGSDLEWSIDGYAESVAFAKTDDADWTLPENQDRITENVWITRCGQYPLFNAYSQGCEQSDGPEGTEWAIGHIDQIEWLNFEPFKYALGQVGNTINYDLIPNDQPVVLHLIEDDIYFEVQFHSWTMGGNGGGFSYTRSVNPATWIYADIESGTITAGSYQDIQVNFSADGIYGGEYSTHIMFNTNIPDKSLVGLPVTLSVTGIADIGVETFDLEFGEVFIGGTHTIGLWIGNSGTDDLIVSDVQSSGSDFTVSSTSFTVSPEDDYELDVSFSPTSLDEQSHTLTIMNNDPDDPVVEINIYGIGIPAPDIAVTPTSISAELLVGETAVRSVSITNEGDNDLLWQIIGNFPRDENILAYFPFNGDSYDQSGNDYHATVYGDVFLTDDHHGNAESAYYFNGDNDESRIVTESDNMDLSNRSHTISLHVKPDEAAYGHSHLFGHGTASGNHGLHSRFQGTESIKYGFWNNDVDVSQPFPGSTDWHHFIYVYDYDNNTRSVYADGILIDEPNYPGSPYQGVGHLVIGSHVYDYSNPDPWHGTIDEFIVWDVALSEEELVMLYENTFSYENTSSDIEWIENPPTTIGVLEIGQSIDLDFTFNAENIYGGNYSTDIVVNSNDPDESEVMITATLDVTGIPEINVEPTTIEFGELFIGVQDSLELVISSIGTDHLNVSDIQIDGDDFTVSDTLFSIAPETADTVRVYFSPTSSGEQSHTITVNSNDPDSPAVDVSVTGTGIEPPDIAVSPDVISADILSGESTIQTISIGNEGSNDLEFSISTEGGGGNLHSVMPLALGNYWRYMEVDEENEEEYWIETDSISLIKEYNGEQYYCWEYDLDTSYDGNIYENWVGWKMSTQDAVWGIYNSDGDTGEEWLLELTLMKYDPYVGQSWTAEWFEGNINFTVTENLDYSSSLGDFTDCWLVEISFDDSEYNDPEYWIWKIGLGPVQRDDNILVEYGLNVDWLTMSPSFGIVSPGSSQDIEVNFDAEGMFTGGYSTDIAIHSNDPDESKVIVPATLAVTGIPEIGIVYAEDPFFEGSEYHFGELYVGSSVSKDFLIVNSGTGELVISDIQVDGGDWMLSSTSLTLPPGQHDTLAVSFTPTTSGEQSQTLTITSNDPGSPLGLTLIGYGVDPPQIVVDIDDGTDTLQVVVPPGDTFDDEMMAIKNDGGTALNIKMHIQDEGSEGSVMPLAVGNSWEYLYYDQDDEGNEEEHYESEHVHHIIEYNGNHYFIIDSDESNWFGFKSGQDAVVAEYSTEDGLKEIKLLSYEPYVGETWIDDDFGGYTITITENLDYTTKHLGTFKDCWKVEMVNSEGFTETWYWKIGIGRLAIISPWGTAHLTNFDFNSNTDWVNVHDYYDIYPGDSDDIYFYFSSNDSSDSGIKMATLVLMTNDPENRLMHIPVKMTLDDSPHPTVLSITPPAGIIDYRTNEIIINMSDQLDPGTVSSSSIEFQGTHSTGLDPELSYVDSSNAIIVTFEDGLVAMDTFSFTLSSDIESYYGYSLDGDADGEGGDDYTSSLFNTSMLGDFDIDGTISVEDLSQFVIALDSDDLAYELGPFEGDIPHVTVSPDSKYDIEDVVAFAMMWNWYSSNNTMTFNSYEDDGLPILIDTEHDSIYIDFQDDLSAYQIQVQYTPGSFFIGSSDNGDDLFFTHQELELGVYTIMAQPGESRLVIPIEIRGRDADISISYKGLTKQGELAGKMTKSMNIANIPDEFVLFSNYPNPFNPSTKIDYGLPDAVNVQLVVYDILGREVITLVNGLQEPGYQSVTWHGIDSYGRNVGAGMYFYLIQAGAFRETHKMLLLK